MRASYGVLNRRRGALLKKIAKTGPFIMATATRLMVKCGNPKCKCATDKTARHEKMHLSWTDAQGNGTCYVPVELRTEVLSWIQNYWQIKTYMKEMTEISRKMIRIYAQTLGRGKRKQQKKKDLKR